MDAAKAELTRMREKHRPPLHCCGNMRESDQIICWPVVIELAKNNLYEI